jgi:hypothetical protein
VRRNSGYAYFFLLEVAVVINDDIRSKVSSLKSEGLSEEQAIAAKPSAEYDGKWGTSIINPALFVHLIYVSLPAGR